MSPYLLFFWHKQAILWHASVAKELKARSGVKAVAWVIGERDRRTAEETQVFDRVVNLLDGFTLHGAEKAADENDEFLAAFEKKCGQTCYNEDVAIDRHVRGRHWAPEKIAHYASHLIKAMEADLQVMQGAPSAAFGENNALAYRLAHRVLGSSIPFWNFTVVRHWEGRFFLDHDQSEQWPECRRLYQEYMEQGIPEPLRRIAEERLDELRTRQVQPVYYQAYKREGLFDKLRLSRLRKALNIWLTERDWIAREGGANPQALMPQEFSPIAKLMSNITQAIRRRAFDTIAEREVSLGDYCLYFLHVEPEYSVEGLAFPFRDQGSLIETIAANLPAGMKLVVKEHKPMVGVRDTAAYRRLLAIPNVVLLTDSASSYKVVKGARMVFTLTGTVALEALYVGVPSIAFGDIYFDSFHGIYKVDRLRDLRGVVESVLGTPGASPSTDSALAALSAMYAASSPGKVIGVSPLEEVLSAQNAKEVADAVEHALSREG